MNYQNELYIDKNNSTHHEKELGNIAYWLKKKLRAGGDRLCSPELQSTIRGPIYFMWGTDHEDQPIINSKNLYKEVGNVGLTIGRTKSPTLAVKRSAPKQVHTAQEETERKKALFHKAKVLNLKEQNYFILQASAEDDKVQRTETDLSHGTQARDSHTFAEESKSSSPLSSNRRS
ncbi:hypothetical protein OS493_014717 [Desmophyllum pertusum]|uniref:Uncharacterized protein n=1 Tax=Desmophyllum pertusum TaxID=174260 RepID=A0A9W9YET6_9CNID|nr:hypothetical protein OS493_014717 [Desmophyllum pertusum]